MALSTAPSAAGPSLAERLRDVRVGVRPDLEVSRHVYRGEPCYILRDPLTFQTHRLDFSDYQLLTRLDARHTLGEIRAAAVADGLLAEEDTDLFYRFVLTLHRCGFLSLPVNDEQLLYRRHRARCAAERRQLLTGFFALRLPLFNPDNFLTRTLAVGRLLFSRWCFALWLVLVASALAVMVLRWYDLVQPIHGLLAAHNLPLLWLTLIGLKACHEFGHAYACKHFGGHVPEMGIYLILFTPCAYVDATAAWGFPRRRDRLIVSLAGLYVELGLAALAVFVWATTEPSLLNAAAYNTIFLASTVTVLFNANPLMRYDGYYVLSDLIEVPNLRQRATRAALDVLRRAFLGLPAAAAPAPPRLQALLVGYGLAAGIYRVFVLVAIVAVIASKSFVLGLALGLAYAGLTLFQAGRRLLRYLWFAPETAPARPRAVALSVLLLLLPAALGWLPLPSDVHAAAVVRAENECVVRATVPGLLESVGFEPGQSVRAGDLLAELSNLTVADELARADAAVETCELRRAAYEFFSPVQAQIEAARAAHRYAERMHARSRAAALTVRAPEDGWVVSGVRRTEIGRFVQTGEALATVVAGAWQARAALTTADFAAARPAVGTTVEFRPTAAPHTVWRGVIVRVTPLASRQPGPVALTHRGGGDIAVDAEGRAQQPYIEVVATLTAAAGSDARDNGAPIAHGMTGVMRLRADAAPLAVHAYRRVVQFLDRLRTE